MAATEALEVRLKRVESKIAALAGTVDEMSANYGEHTELAARLSRLEGKVDRLLEHKGMFTAQAQLVLPDAHPVSAAPLNSENVWDTLVAVLQARVSRVRFNTWFRDLSFVSDDGATLRLRGPNALYCEFFQQRFAPIVHELLAEVGRSGTNLVVRPD